MIMLKTLKGPASHAVPVPLPNVQKRELIGAHGSFFTILTIENILLIFVLTIMKTNVKCPGPYIPEERLNVTAFQCQALLRQVSINNYTDIEMNGFLFIRYRESY